MNKQVLFTKVDKILWKEWDPIGVNDYGGPDDEEYISDLDSRINGIENIR